MTPTDNSGKDFTLEIESGQFTPGRQEAEILMNVSLNTRKLRLRLGITQLELAQATKIPQSRISDIETPVPDGLTVRTIARLAAALGVTFKDLISPSRDNYTQTQTIFRNFEGVKEANK